MILHPITYNDEEYKFITQQMVPNVDIGRYLISSHGVVLDTLYNNIERGQTNVNGYLSVSLHLEIGITNQYLVHRLVAMAFIPGDWSLQVNHKDGRKNNNHYTNLEWVTPRQNLMHALDMGLNHRGEKKPNAILTNDQVHQICKYLEDRHDYSYIKNIMNLDYENIDDILHCIKCKKSWRFISKDYDIPNHRIVNNRFLSNEQAISICIAMSQNPKIKNSELFELVGLDVSDKEKYEKARHCIESIKARKAYRDISDVYLV